MHGCPCCHLNCRLVPKVHLDHSMEEVYDVTSAKTTLLHSMGFTEVKMWECFWVDLSKHNPRLIQFLHTLEIVEPLDLRDAFYGGRTGATSLYHKTNEAQGEKYITPMSLLNIRRWTNTEVISWDIHRL